MNRHPIDATALIFGLLFTLSGFAIVSEEAWPELDTTTVVGAVVGVLGLLFVAVLVMRQLREGSQPPADPPPPVESTTADDPVTISE
ncbi:MAG: hypothetical protein AAGA90_13690 [Actinomycetota bacterium]